MEPVEINYEDFIQDAQFKNQVLCLISQTDANNQMVSSWSSRETKGQCDSEQCWVFTDLFIVGNGDVHGLQNL